MLKKFLFKNNTEPKIEVTTNEDSVKGLINHAAGFAMLGLNPDIATLRQEEMGQRDFINSVQMPIKTNPNSGLSFAVDVYTRLGFKFLVTKESEVLDPKDDDDLFMDVVLPDGWRKEGSRHAMWSYVFDDKGRERMSVFYKGSSHDRSAFINVNPRYRAGVETVLPQGEKREDWYYKSQSHLPQYGYIKDGGVVIWQTGVMTPTVGAEYNTPGNYLNDFSFLGNAAKLKLNALFPKNEDPFAYWD